MSQFEQQVRTLCGLPLGEIRLLSPAVMLNLIGERFDSPLQPLLRKVTKASRVQSSICMENA